MDYLNDLLPEFKLATKRIRWIAAFIDYFIYMVLIFSFTYAFGDKVPNEDGGTTYQINGGFPFLFLILIWLIFFPVVEFLNGGKTLGKRLMKIQAAKQDGSKASFGQVLARHLLDFVDYLPFFGVVGLIVASNTPQKQRVGDLVAKTIVIEAT